MVIKYPDGVQRDYSIKQADSIRHQMHRKPFGYGRHPKSKYHARELTVDGHRFDSKLEYRFYQFLKLSGADFKCHPRFTVLGHSKWNRKHSYTPDFVTYKDGKPDQVFDCKGIARVPAYDHLRFDLFARKYHQHVTVVRWKHGRFVFKIWK